MAGARVIQVTEQRIAIDGADVTRKTVFEATRAGTVGYVQNTVQPPPYYPPPQQPVYITGPVIAPPPPPPPPPQVVAIPVTSSKESCFDYGCCESDPSRDWYSLSGKGIGLILLLLLMYLVFGAVALAVFAAWMLCVCFLSND